MMSRFFGPYTYVVHLCHKSKNHTGIPPYPTFKWTSRFTAPPKKKNNFFIRISVAEMADSLNQVITDSFIVFLLLLLSCIFVL